MQLLHTLKETFQQSGQEMKKISTLTGSAMLIALGAVLNQLTIGFTPTLRMSFAFVATALSGMLYGPLTAGMVGVLADLLRWLIVGGGAYHPGFGLNEFLAGMIYGMLLYRKKPSLWNVGAARALVAATVNLCLTPLWLSMLYGNRTIGALMLERVPKNLILLPFEIGLLYALSKAVSSLRQKSGTPRP